MAGISGIGSGIDTAALVQALVGAERAPKEAQLARLEKASTTKFTGLGQLKSAISDFTSALATLKSADTFNKRTVTSSNKEAVTATATTSAQTGSYSLEVSRLASSSKVASKVIAGGASADFQAGTLTLTRGSDSFNVAVSDGDTLQNIRDKINTDLAAEGISANLVSDPSSGDTRLVISSNKTGTGNDVAVTALNTGGTATNSLNELTIDSSVAQSGAAAGYITQALNAQFKIDGLSLESATNSVEGAVDGVTFNLSAVTTAAATLKVDQGTSAVSTEITKFTDAYNKLIGTINQLSSVVPVGGSNPVVGPLAGDATARTLLTGVRNELVAPSDQDGIKILAELGITTQKDGTLKIDTSKLGTAITDNFDQLSNYFAGDNGLMARLENRLKPYTETTGIIQQRLDSLQGTIKSVDSQREALNLRMAKVEERLVARFTAMDTLVAQLQATSNRLTQSLASLPGVSSGS
ncbi:flagellar filament capping protein FliD [Atopomonas sediminilitoris]|uniref:flagellar filament capping protein FliD n=1 Tax=Atopomonas sediminilitoris TaxID=2919919 RepID=UPI001F4D6B57|nr:flagellar filament capping protein FliD [Atopomonas sediminilitoris]MCJ8167959.1 flagellar filament capping protein FliD [Atopomonas sediminilitoris]